MALRKVTPGEGGTEHHGPSGGPRRVVELSRAESMRRLASVSLGRVVFTRNALPAIRPVSHLVDHGAVIIRSELGAAALSALGTVVAYEADDIDPHTYLGWSVVVTGVARRFYSDGGPRSGPAEAYVPEIRIEPSLVTGFVLTDAVP